MRPHENMGNPAFSPTEKESRDSTDHVFGRPRSSSGRVFVRPARTGASPSNGPPRFARADSGHLTEVGT